MTQLVELIKGNALATCASVVLGAVCSLALGFLLANPFHRQWGITHWIQRQHEDALFWAAAGAIVGAAVIVLYLSLARAQR